MVKHWRRGSVASVAVIAAIGVLLPSSAPARTASTGRTVEVIVGGRTLDHAAAAIEAVGGTVTMSLPIIDGVSGTVDASLVDEIERQVGVSWARLNERVHLQGNSDKDNNGTVRSVFAREIEADKLWDQGITGAGVRVALIDTGVTPVADLDDRLVTVPDVLTGRPAPCANFSGEPHCDDSYGHGTFIAGLIAGTGDLSNGTFKGVAPGAEIVSVKIAGRDGSSDVTKILAAIQWVVAFRERLGIRVLNLSLGTNSPVSSRLDPLNFAVQRAWRSGIAVVVAASNRGPNPQTISKPADDPLVITTGAVDDRETTAVWDDMLPDFSGRGPTIADGIQKPDVVAPGARVVSLRAPGSFVEQQVPGRGVDEHYRRASGTSFSAGIVSGAAALALQSNPNWTPDRLKFAFASTARLVASTERNDVGFGLINVYKAARQAPSGLANQFTTTSAGTGTLDGSRADMRVAAICTNAAERLSMPQRCDVIEGSETAQGRTFKADEYRNAAWTEAQWYESQWSASSVLGTSWYGTSWYGASWYGASWYGASWYGQEDEDESYGAALLGASWYGAWD